MTLPLPVADLIDDCNMGPLMVERKGQPTKNAHGGFDDAPVTLIRFNPIAAHNTSGRDLDQVPEADRNSELVTFQAKRRFFVADGGQAADVVRYQGRRFRVVAVMDYTLQGGVYIAHAALVDVQNT